jgi:cell division protein FtsB
VISFKKRKFRTYLFLFFFLVGFFFLLFNNQGVIKYLKLKKQVENINSRIDSLDEQNKRLQGEADSLREKIPAKIERTAREKYDMLREGEKLIIVKEE